MDPLSGAELHMGVCVCVWVCVLVLECVCACVQVGGCMDVRGDFCAWVYVSV